MLRRLVNYFTVIKGVDRLMIYSYAQALFSRNKSWAHYEDSKTQLNVCLLKLWLLIPSNLEHVSTLKGYPPEPVEPLYLGALADLHTKFSGARPLWDPIPSFSHTFSRKSAHVGGPRPPKMGPHPPMGNPGSAPEVRTFYSILWIKPEERINHEPITYPVILYWKFHRKWHLQIVSPQKGSLPENSQVCFIGMGI